MAADYSTAAAAALMTFRHINSDSHLARPRMGGGGGEIELSKTRTPDGTWLEHGFAERQEEDGRSWTRTRDLFLIRSQRGGRLRVGCGPRSVIRSIRGRSADLCGSDPGG